MSNRADHPGMLAEGRLVNHYQPVVNLQSGAVLGVETLTRLMDGTSLIGPRPFLPGLGVDALHDLLFASFGMGLGALAACRARRPALFMSFNVSPSVMLRRGFRDRLLDILVLNQVDPVRITLEVLEDDEFLLPQAHRRLEELHAAGISIALDDVGTGCSSLNRLRKLPLDTIKLDQAFVRELPHQPESLHFVSAMLSLARGSHNLLIVEGVETVEIMAALGVIGVEGAQGYAIARPMPRAALLEWLAGHVPAPMPREPRSLLGAYAAHLSIVEACRALLNQPLKFDWSADIRDPHACSIGRYLDEIGLHDSPCCRAHKRFHQVIDCHGSEPAAWEQAATDLWRSLQEAINAQRHACREASADAASVPHTRRIAIG